MLRQKPFRFLHAADLHLEKQVTGPTELPPHLVPRVVDAPRLAAERIFNVAVAEQVDFVLLSGNILNPYLTGPWGPMFLAEQFNRLNASNIPVYWAAGKADAAERWPLELTLPPNVTLFSASHVETLVFEKGGVPIAQIQGVSRTPERRKIRPREFGAEQTGLFTIAVASGKINPAHLKKSGVDYWALGGMLTRRTSYGNAALSKAISQRTASQKAISQKTASQKTASPKKEPLVSEKPQLELVRSSVVHYPGASVARTIDDTGHYGATLVSVDEYGKIHPLLVSVSPIRFANELVQVESITSLDRLKEELRERLTTHQSLQEDYDLFVNWTLQISRELEVALSHHETVEQMRNELRREFGMREPFAWVLEISPAIPETFPPEYYEQETILGDYLRKFRLFQTAEVEMPSLEQYLPHDENVFPLEEPNGVRTVKNQNHKNQHAEMGAQYYVEQLKFAEEKKCDQLLREAAMLGVELLGNKEEKKKR